MTQEEIKEGELVINEFMERPIKDDPRHGILYLCPITKVYGKDMKYHSSWDWLMPVYKKFADIEHLFEDEDYIWYCNKISQSLKTGFINLVFKDLVTSINWYNQNIKDNEA